MNREPVASARKPLWMKAAMVFMALAVALCASPAFAATEYIPSWKTYKTTLPEGEPVTWNIVASAMDILFDAALESFEEGDLDAAWTAINQAYYGYYEITGFERSAMSYIAGSRKTEVENQFSLCKSIAKKDGTLEQFTEAVETLRSMIHVDANKLDGVEDSSGGSNLANTAAFVGAFGILLREGIEAMLVIGAIIAYLVKAGQRKSLRQVYIGAILGVVCSFIVAGILYSLGFGDGSEQQEIIEGVAALIAVVMLFWVSNWMLSKSETEAWNNYIKKAVASATATGSVFALAFTAWLAVFREGAEVVLFLYPLVSSSDPVAIWGGILAGFVALAIIFIVMRVFSVKLPLKPFFMVMSILMFVMCISFLGSGINELIEGNVITGTYIPWIPTGNDVLTVLGINPWVETVVPQLVLLVITIVIYIVHFAKEKKSAASGEVMIDPTKTDITEAAAEAKAEA